ncbi:rhomboid family intramembrane serine protease [Mucilaginibacter aquaedulcis]|uniref:rhomboid family intramembrane serine protease n=1 Tax=Mucilaginibacter aquaedulcis TaxID=1187081 RepID=UPI0025B58882|nr:rhomboid family intramembrane serine protease [Mucilaginibacter aquaedulcis]MDN3551123.1 rhomboid family intramembrane serine protease [Mucilaginibacter aquaedulcis]
MNSSPFANISPVVKNLLIINVLFFIGTYTLGSVIPDVIKYLPVYYFNSPNFRLWEVITYMFMHGGFAHIFFNMFALFSFGPIVEYSMGPKKFLSFYFICGIGAIILQMLVQALEVHAITGGITIQHPGLDSSYLAYGAKAQSLYELYNTPVVGASGAIFGLLIAFGMLFPNMELMILFLPVPIKAKYIIPVYVVLELFLGVKQFSGDSVAHFAHLGGAILGYIMVKYWRLQRPNNFY